MEQTRFKVGCGAAAVVLGLMLASPADATTILFDFGRGVTATSDLRTTGNWNNIDTLNNTTDSGTGGTGIRISGAVTSDGGKTGVALRFIDDFSHMDYGGVVASDVYPSSAQRDSFMVTPTNPGKIRLEGLTVGETYDLKFFGSRDATTLRREFTVTIAGHNAVTLDNAANRDKTVSISGVTPDAEGGIVIDITTQGNFGYFGVMEVNGAFAIPEPSSAALMGLAAFAGLQRRGR